MAKNAITDWSATAGSNTDIGGTGILGSNLPRNFDDALRELMAQLAKVNAGTDAVADTWAFGDPAGLTKRVRLDAGNVTAGQTRVLTMPDSNVTLTAGVHDLGGLAKTDGNIHVGDGTNWVAESGATLRTSIGLGTIATQAANNVTISGGSVTGITDITVADGGTGASAAAAARTNLAAIGVVRVQTFTSSGTYTPHANMLYCRIECLGGGGGSAGTADSGAGDISSGGGGGGGGYSIKIASAADIGASQTVTIGAAGAAGASGNNAGGNGGNTSVGVLCIANGGSGGPVATNRIGGAGGTAGTGDITAPGMPGGAGQVVTGTINNNGNGGSSLYGAGGLAVFDGTGNAATGYGGGGGSSQSYNASGAKAGAAGTAGLVIVTEYCSE